MKRMLPLLIICSSLFSYEIGEWEVDGNVKRRIFYENGKEIMAELHFRDERLRELQGRTHLFLVGLPKLVEFQNLEKEKGSTLVTITFDGFKIASIDCHSLGPGHYYKVVDRNSDGILDCLLVYEKEGDNIGIFTIANGRLEPVDEKTKSLLDIGGGESDEALKRLINKRLEQDGTGQPM